jgi:hypothetical protein
MASYILMTQLEVREEHAVEFNRLYNDEHVPSLLSVEGVLSGQRYELQRKAEDQLRYLAIYELERPGIPDSDEWHKAANTPAWSAMRNNITVRRRRGVFRKI